jgi:uncharacterized 2Fe-2S/4Fe-4S cluster protein (DUF4445 family)
MSDSKIRLEFRPSGQVVHVPAGTTIFNAASWAGLTIDAACGGQGTCGKCKVRVLSGLQAETPDDLDHLTADELAAGWRLSCRATVRGETVVEVPRLLTKPKAAVVGTGRQVALAPNIHKIHVVLPEPTLEDQRADLTRLSDALKAEGFGMSASIEMTRILPSALRESGWSVTAVLAGSDLIAVEPGNTTKKSYGLAVDIGTTTVVVNLMDLTSGAVTGVEATLNGQAVFGADVIARIGYAMTNPEGLHELQDRIVQTLNGLIDSILARTGVSPDNVYEAMIAGNTTMQHLFLGVSPAAIAATPFIPVFEDAGKATAGPLGLHIHPRARVCTFPVIGGYVGGDIVSGILATSLDRDRRTRLLIDVGTNGEIVLGSNRRVVACSTAAGPAFEGAQMACGMRAAPGAIEGVTITRSTVQRQVIGNEKPVGICGSGLIDVVAQLYLVGLLDENGRLADHDEAMEIVEPSVADRIVQNGSQRSFVLATAEETGGAPVTLSQRDIRELQYAKGAMKSGIAILQRTLGIEDKDIEQVMLAGSFGSYINPASARAIGLVPMVAQERIVAVGNTAGEGAKMAMLSFREREAARVIPGQVEYLELSALSTFTDDFVDALSFPPKSEL